MVKLANPQSNLFATPSSTNDSRIDEWKNRLRLITELPKLLTDQQHVVFRDWSLRYGDRFSIKVANQNYVFLSDPVAIKCCFDFSEEQIDAGSARRKFVGFMPADSLLLSSGPRHPIMRRAIGKAMARAGDSYCIASAVDKLVALLENETCQSFERRVNRLLLEIISQFLIGKIDRRFIAAMKNIYKSIEQISTATMVFPSLRRLPPFTKGHVNVANAIAELNHELVRLIEAGVPERCFLSNMLLQASKNEITLPEVIDNIAMFCFVMPRSLNSIFQNVTHELAAEAEWQTILRNSIASGFNSQQLMRATVKETLRIAPMIPILVRTALCDLEVDGFAVQKDDIIIITPYLTHFRASSFPNPKKFDPTRFIGSHNYANQYIPYGGGRNHCVGSGWSVDVICKLFLRLLPIVKFSSPQKQAKDHATLNAFSMRALFLKRKQSQVDVRFV